MNRVGYVFAVCLAAGPPVGQAQTSHERHKPAQETPRAASENRPDSAPSARGGSLYRSAFSDYRPFNPDEPPKDWRQANEEVRDSGGQAGLLKGHAKPNAHSGHGAPKGRQ